MPKAYHTSTSAQLSKRQEQISALLMQQKKAETLQSAVVGFAVVGLMCAILALFKHLSQERTVDIIVTYNAPLPKEERPDQPKDIAKAIKPRPNSSSSAMARVIAATTKSEISMPVPENPNPATPFGIDDDFKAGFGVGDGDGDGGGGGSSFFGTYRAGKRVCFIVDFSLSMESDIAQGGTRIDGLKKELIKSINALDSKMNFNVIFFSHNAWTVDTPGPNQADKGWNGLNEIPFCRWFSADSTNKQKICSAIQSMPAQGNTGWYAPLKMALNMMPKPDVIYLLSDGEARDSNVVMNEMKTLNPSSIPIDTFAFELPGTPAYDLKQIAKMSAGNFVLFYQGKRYPGESARKFLSSSYDE